VCNRSAYGLYVRDTMLKLRGSSDNSAKQHMRECAQGWSKLGSTGKQHYKDLLNRERQQYLANVEQFKKVLTLPVWVLGAVDELCRFSGHMAQK